MRKAIIIDGILYIKAEDYTKDLTDEQQRFRELSDTCSKRIAELEADRDKYREAFAAANETHANEIAELEADNKQLKLKHSVACDTISRMQDERKERHKNCVSTEQYVTATVDAANEFESHHEAMLSALESAQSQAVPDKLRSLFARIRPDCEVAGWVYREIEAMLTAAPTPKENNNG